MKRILNAFCLLLLMATAANAATADEVQAWKRRFPGVALEAPFELRTMVSRYEAEVSQITKEGLYPAIARLRQRAQNEISDASLAS